jgi:3-hydroxybutyryl-CoA dehydrogenase
MTLGIQKIGILGAGQMGAGIAQTGAQSGFQIFLADQNRDFAEKSRVKIGAQLKKQTEKGKITAEEELAAIERIKVVGSIQDFSQVDLVIESVSENPEIKYSI